MEHVYKSVAVVNYHPCGVAVAIVVVGFYPGSLEEIVAHTVGNSSNLLRGSSLADNEVGSCGSLDAAHVDKGYVATFALAYAFDNERSKVVGSCHLLV